MSVTKGVANKWDTETQEVHGGQTWSQLADRLVDDFSVTTNGLGTPQSAMAAASSALSLIDHYPAADCSEALAALGEFCRFPANRMLVGNGASEFIDLAMRLGKQPGTPPVHRVTLPCCAGV